MDAILGFFGTSWAGSRMVGRCLAIGLVMLALARAGAGAQEGLDSYPPDAYPPDAYPLDVHEREVPARRGVHCPEVALVTYRGEVVRFRGAIKVHPAFRERLRRFEEVVQQVAEEIYGRAPRRIVHGGGFHCRRIKRFPNLLSEHALGNAIDVSGFDFGPSRRGAALPEGMPKKLRRAFRVRLLQHWTARDAVGRVHSQFLQALARRLIARDDVFRVLLGPSWPGHRDHFHFDCANYRLVSVFAPADG